MFTEAGDEALFYKKYSEHPPGAATNKLDEYIKLWKGNAFRNPAGKEMHNVVRVFKSPTTKVVMETGEVGGAAVLKEGVKESWGYKHIFEYIRPNDATTRAQQIMQAFPDSFRTNDDILRGITETLEFGTKQGDEIIKAFPSKNGGSRFLRVVLNNEGSVTTIIPGDLT